MTLKLIPDINVNRLARIIVYTGLCCVLAGCNQQDSEPSSSQKIHIKPAIKLGTDASGLARDTHAFLTRINPQQLQGTVSPAMLEQQVFAPVRQLLVRWRTEIKQTDSVVGDQYTICYAALLSLDAWARTDSQQRSSRASKQQIYDNQKKLCDQAISAAKK